MIALVALVGALVGGFMLYIVDHLDSWGLLPIDDAPIQSVILTPSVVISTMSMIFGLLYLAYGMSATFGMLIVAGSLFALITLVDLRYRFILNVMIYPSLIITFAVHLLLGHSIAQILMGGIFALSIFFAVAVATSGGLGMGDVKLATLIGITVGFPGVVWALIVGVGAGGLLAIVLIARGYSRKLTVPYAPFLCLGAMIALLYNPFTLTL